jgi:hypothetical protein
LSSSCIIFLRVAKLTLLSNHKHRNERYDDGGGAIRTTDDAGEVNIAECVFYRNAGTMGGAIFSRAFRLNIVSTNMTQNEATVRSPSASHWH